ncbi:MAG: trehalose-6-phosphate synthase [Planctomycetes bacterium]|nr:trehalose-6-phosphate synthase [Planctomycetota bacterium]
MAAKDNVLIIANRLPIHRVRSGRHARWDTSPGGLVTALSPILKGSGSGWIGWPGGTTGIRTFKHDGMRMIPIHLSSSEVEQYYHGFSNATIWPLYHDAIRTPTFNRKWWKPFVDVNKRFAQAAARVATPRQRVWIHDYQLQLVPKMLRELRPDLRIGFFLHIPFPPEELFAWLPWRREIIEGLLGADLIGFQTTADARDFSRAARLFTSATGTDHALRHKSRPIKIDTFPVSVDSHEIERCAADPHTIGHAQELRRRVGASRRIILAVDRLDYTKGIDLRLLAFEELLRRGLATVDECVMIQVASPTRETVSDYVEMRTTIERIVGRINGEYSIPGRVAVHYFRRSIPRRELVAYYAAADVMMVTPLRDGMNLVAKEYVSSRLDHSGALVLSEFAGAAQELRQAYLVNPWDMDGMVRSMDIALRQSRKDGRLRMGMLRMHVRRHHVHQWGRDFMGAMPE